MDHWGDPWAEDAKSPNKPPVTSPLPPSSTTNNAPALLTGFLDDAGWGDDGGFAEEWGEPVGAAHANHVLEPPDVSTAEEMNTAQAAPEVERTNQEEEDESQDEEVDIGTRPSTSPSESSHIDNPIESSRTSYEEEHHNKAQVSLPELPDDLGEKDDTPLASETTSDHENQEPQPREVLSTPDPVFEKPTVSNTNKNEARARSLSYTIEPSLLSELFPASTAAKKVDDAPDNIIFSTGSRKAWYRLTRKQTMREYNNGTDDENYVRITWTNSNIRSEVNKIVGRWAREDRLSGTGPGARASFYWDTPAPDVPVKPFMHARHQSVITTSSTMTMPNRQSLPAVSTKVPAAFNWSSPSAPVDPWLQNSPSMASFVAPIPEQQPAKTEVPKQDIRPEPLDFSVFETQPPLAAPSATSTPVMSTITALNMGKKAAEPQQNGSGANAFEDDDEWGEMVSTPQESTFGTDQTLFNSETPKSIFTTPAASQTNKPAPLHDQLADPTHASPITRLKSTVSPTSALFKPKMFVPLSTDHGPIGPHMLKPANRAVSLPSQKPIDEEVSLVESSTRPMKVTDRVASLSLPTRAEPEPGLLMEDSSTTGIDVLSSMPDEPAQSIGIAGPTEQVDAWADADFSFFETAAPANIPDPQPEQKFPSSSLSAFTPLTPTTMSAAASRIENDRVVQDIIDGLPDLSYMLK